MAIFQQNTQSAADTISLESISSRSDRIEKVTVGGGEALWLYINGIFPFLSSINSVIKEHLC